MLTFNTAIALDNRCGVQRRVFWLSDGDDRSAPNKNVMRFQYLKTIGKSRVRAFLRFSGITDYKWSLD
jgi:hypothetical protein